MATRTPATTMAAYHALKPGPLKAQLLELIETAGIDGCIHEDIRAVFPMASTKDGTLNTRYSELERDSLIFRNGDTRPGLSGREQMVMRHHTFAAALGVALPTSTRKSPLTKRNPFMAGVMHAAKTVLKASDLAEAKRLLKAELLTLSTK